MRSSILLALSAVLGGACARPAAPPRTAGADTRADQAALYALPLVIMDLTREQFFADPMPPATAGGRPRAVARMAHAAAGYRSTLRGIDSQTASNGPARASRVDP
jgi:hypothetical protein